MNRLAASRAMKLSALANSAWWVFDVAASLMRSHFTLLMMSRLGPKRRAAPGCSTSVSIV